MKNYSMLLILGLAAMSTAYAQGGPSGKTLAASMEVYVFPKEGQQAAQQSKDEANCYQWAASSTGADPFELQRQSVAEAQQTEQAKAEAQQIGRGAGLKGAQIAGVCESARDLTGRTSFADIVVLARSAALAVGNDTGPMHLIAGAGCRCVVLFSGASDPALTAPRAPKGGGEVVVVRRDDLGALGVDEVERAATKLLG